MAGSAFFPAEKEPENRPDEWDERYEDTPNDFWPVCKMLSTVFNIFAPDLAVSLFELCFPALRLVLLFPNKSFGCKKFLFQTILFGGLLVAGIPP